MADNDIVTGTSFADLPDVRINAQGEQVVSVPEPPPPPQNQQAQAPPQMQYVPVPVPMAQPRESNEEFLQKLALARAEGEREKQEKDQREFWSRAATPPTVPDEDDLADPKKVREALINTQTWAKNLISENARVFGQAVAPLHEEANNSRMSRAQLALQDARNSLLRQGMTDVDNYWQPVEQMLQRDPANYWKIRTNAGGLETAVKMFRDNAVRNGQVVPMQAQAPPTSIPYGQAASPQPQGNQNQGMDPGLRRVEKIFGIQFTDKDLAKRRVYNR